MVYKCKHCGKPIIKNPLWKGQEKGEPFSFDKLIWINLFKIDWWSIILILIVIGMVVGYKADISKCDEVIEKPCAFCSKSNCCNAISTDGVNTIFNNPDLIPHPDEQPTTND